MDNRLIVLSCLRTTGTRCVTIQMKAIKQYFHVVLFIVLYKVKKKFEVLMKPYLRLLKLKLLHGSFMWYVYFAVQGGD